MRKIVKIFGIGVAGLIIALVFIPAFSATPPLILNGLLPNQLLNASNNVAVEDDNWTDGYYDESEVIIPKITFVADDFKNTITVVAAYPEDVLWDDILVNGTCNTSGLGTYVEVGDIITDCHGPIAIFYIPTDTLIANFTFIDDTPKIILQADDFKNTITVLSADPGLNWSDVGVLSPVGPLNIPTGSIDVGDIITECIGNITVTIVWIPTSTILAIFDFTSYY